MRILKSLFGLVFLLIVQLTFSQERKLGTWKMFMPYGHCVALCDAGEKVFSAADQSIFSYDRTTGAIQTYDKATGLNDIGIKAMNYDATTKALVIAYIDNNIDIIFNGTDVYNIPDIKNKAISTGAISIYTISFYQGNAYVSSDIGISVIDLTKKEISNTYIIGANGGQVKVYASSIDGTNVYAATDEGLKYAPVSSPNLSDFNAWTIFNSTAGLRATKFIRVCSYNNKVYAVCAGTSNNSDSLFVFNGSQWSYVYSNGNDTFIYLSEVNGNLYFSGWDQTTYSGLLGKIDNNSQLIISATSFQVPQGWFESNGVAWIGDYNTGLNKINQGITENIIPDGPYSSGVFALNCKNGILDVAAGGQDGFWGYSYNGNGFYIWQNGKWYNHNMHIEPALSGAYDIICTATIPDKGKTYFGSFLDGLIELDDKTGAINIYNQYNSICEGAMGDPGSTRITSLAVDKHDNLWIANGDAIHPIKLIEPNGTWKEFTFPYQEEVMKKLIIDQNDQLWIPIRGAGSGIVVWSYNNTIEDATDDLSRHLISGSGLGGLPDVEVNSIIEDLDGNIWVGTNQGIAVYYCPGGILTPGGCDAEQIKVERDGYIGYLFGTETVRALAVDASNRKWVGTNNGVWLVSADGKTELLKFNTDNSPLPNNLITDIAVNDLTGEVFIGTNSGLSSYQGDAMGACNDCNEALVYPNPVKPDYTGPIAIKGLTDNAYVKITDVSGSLIYQGKANGSQMVWDGKGYNGTRAKSGVYLVFSSTDLGKEKRVAKILLSN